MKKILLIHFIIIGFFANSLFAEKLSLSAHNSIIQKLESASQVNDDDKMVMKNELAIRLADLYAERARLLSLEKNGEGEKKYSQEIKSDREKSIQLLTKIVKNESSDEPLEKADKGRIYLQMAHLHELMFEKNEALKIYNMIENKKNDFDPKTVSLTEIKLGDEAFYKGQFEESKKFFERALNIKENPRKSYTHYRIIWNFYNLGQTQIAEQKLFSLLNNKNLFTNSQGVIDESFLNECSHDLATFMAHNDITADSLKRYIHLTPVESRKTNLIYLANELDRTAKKNSALKVWALVGTQKLNFEDQVDRQVQITKIQYDLYKVNDLNSELEKSIKLLTDSRCSNNPICDLGKQNIKKLISDWAHSEQRMVSVHLIAAFQKYTTAFQDYEMNYWAANLSLKIKKQQEAFNFYNQAATLLKDINPKSETQKKIFEASLLGSIQVAEFAKNPDLKLTAYKRYLDFNPQGEQASEVKYQIAHWYYEQNKYIIAHDEFKKLVLDKSIPESLKVKAADLCLDTNVLLKNEKQMEFDSLELAQLLPSKKTEYLKIYRKSVLNQTAQVLNSKPTNDLLNAELNKLTQINSNLFENDEKKLFIKNLIEISYRLNQVDSLIKYTNILVKSNTLTEVEQQKAYEYLAWASEIKLNFKESLNYLKKIKPSKKDLADYSLKVAFLKELSQLNPSFEYEQFLQVSRSKEKSAFAAHQLILFSRNPLKTFENYEIRLYANKSLYSSAALFVFEKTKNLQFADKILRKSFFKNSAEALLIEHQNTLSEFKKINSKIAQDKFRNKNEVQIQESLVQRTQLIKKFETLINKSITKKDTFEQLSFLPYLAKEYNRIASEIEKTSAPKKMSAQEKQLFQNQITSLINDFKQKAIATQQKHQELWTISQQNNYLSDLIAWSMQTKRPGHQFASQELSQLKASAQIAGVSSSAFEKLTETKQKMSIEAEQVQEDIRKNPFNFSNLTKLKNLETSSGNGTMVAYLDYRISELNLKGATK